MINKLLIFILAVLPIQVCFADQIIELEKIVVTPYRYGEALEKTVSSVEVIQSEDIENSNAKNVVDLLRSVSGVSVRDWYGNGTKVAVDMAGFGEQAALNVLVLVDGRRINDVDLSGVDWNQISLDQVDKIEVIRGGSAAVLYGDNASSGVINIVTKKGFGKLKVESTMEYGSYDMNKQKLSLSGSVDDEFSYFLSVGREATHGYRKNTFNKSKNFLSKFEYSLNDNLSLHFNSGFYASTYGLSGALFDDNITQNNRRYSRFGDDKVNNKDYYFVFGAKSDLSNLGNLDVDFSYRRKDTSSYFVFNNLKRRNKIDTFGIATKYRLENSLFNRDNKFIVGLDYSRVVYDSDNFNYTSNFLNDYTNNHKTSTAGYFQNQFSVFDQLTLVSGYRYEVVQYVLGYHDNEVVYSNPDQDKKIQTKMEIFNCGLVYNYADDSSMFLNGSKSFRFPEVDEFSYMDSAYKQQLDTDLKPQSSINYQIGLRHKFSDWIKGDFSLFRMEVDNELYYNATHTFSYGYWDGRNDNYDKTIHQGLETSFDAQISGKIIFFGNYTFTKAFFDGGDYDANEIPLAPRHKGSLGLRLILPKNLTLNLLGIYVGERYFLNDQANAYSCIKDHIVADTNLSWQSKNITITFSINNLFNKQYSEYAGVLQGWSTSQSVGDKFYYPSPERNFSLMVKYTF